VQYGFPFLYSLGEYCLICRYYSTTAYLREDRLADHHLHIAIGAVAALITVFGFTEPDRESTKVPLHEKFATLDPISSCILLGTITCLLLALQWGGVTLPWSNSKVWGCLLGFILLVVVFVALQIHRKER
jgi:hypothetical protein